MASTFLTLATIFGATGLVAHAQFMPAPCRPYASPAPTILPYRQAPIVRPYAPLILPPVYQPAPPVSLLPPNQTPCSVAPPMPTTYNPYLQAYGYNPYLMYPPPPPQGPHFSLFLNVGMLVGKLLPLIQQQWHPPIHRVRPIRPIRPIHHRLPPVQHHPIPPVPIPPPPTCHPDPSMWDAVHNIEQGGVIPPGQHNDDNRGPRPMIVSENGRLRVRFGPPKISNCVDATAAVFDQHVVDLANAGNIKLSPREINILNGTEVQEALWGNTYSVARLMARMGGESVRGDHDGDSLSAALAQAKPGDFLKFDRFNRTGHSTIFKNVERDQSGHISKVCYWSSDQGTDGVGVQCEPVSAIQDVVISRFPKHPDFDHLVDENNPNDSILTQKVDYLNQFSPSSDCGNASIKDQSRIIPNTPDATEGVK